MLKFGMKTETHGGTTRTAGEWTGREMPHKSLNGRYYPGAAARDQAGPQRVSEGQPEGASPSRCRTGRADGGADVIQVFPPSY